jgi:hypothetical protein
VRKLQIKKSMNHLNILHHYGAVVRAALLACFFIVVDLGEGRAGDHVACASAELATKLKRIRFDFRHFVGLSYF